MRVVLRVWQTIKSQYVKLGLLPFVKKRCGELRTKYNLGEELQRRLNKEQNKEEQILIFSCCIDKLRTQIRKEPDIDYQNQLGTLLAMMILCRNTLE